MFSQPHLMLWLQAIFIKHGYSSLVGISRLILLVITIILQATTTSFVHFQSLAAHNFGLQLNIHYKAHVVQSSWVIFSLEGSKQSQDPILSAKMPGIQTQTRFLASMEAKSNHLVASIVHWPIQVRILLKLEKMRLFLLDFLNGKTIKLAKL